MSTNSDMYKAIYEFPKHIEDALNNFSQNSNLNNNYNDKMTTYLQLIAISLPIIILIGSISRLLIIKDQMYTGIKSLVVILI